MARRHPRRVRGSVAALLLIAAGSALHASAADDNLTRMQTQEKAASEFRLLIMEANRSQDRSKLDSEQAMALVRTISDQKYLLDEPTYTVADMEHMPGLCLHVTSTSMSIMTFGIDPADLPSQKDAAYWKKVNQQVTANLKHHELQMLQLMPFMLRCMQPMVVVADQYLSSVEAAGLSTQQRKSLTAMRTGISGGIMASVDSIEDAGDLPALRSVLVESLADVAPTYAGMLPVKDRPMIAERIRAARQKVEAKHLPLLEKAAEAFSDERCDALCRY